MQSINSDIITYTCEIFGTISVWASVHLLISCIEKIENLFRKGENDELQTI